MIPVKAIAIDQFIARIKRHKWLKPDQTKDTEIPEENKAQVKQALIEALTALARVSQPIRQKHQEGRTPKESTISVARAVCEQIFPPQSRTFEQHIVATTLQVRLKQSPHLSQELAGRPDLLKQFINIIEVKLEKSQADTKTKDQVIDDIIQAAMREALTRKGTLAPTAISGSESGQNPAAWKERVQSKRRPSVVLASAPGIGLGC